MVVPIATYGSQAQVSEGVRAKLLPEYDVVHTCLSMDTASTELPALFGGDLDVPSASGFGTNAARGPAERLTPKILFFGASIPASEVEQVCGAVRARAPDAHFVQVTPEDIRAAGGQGPDLDVISKVLKEKFEKIYDSESE